MQTFVLIKANKFIKKHLRDECVMNSAYIFLFLTVTHREKYAFIN